MYSKWIYFTDISQDFEIQEVKEKELLKKAMESVLLAKMSVTEDAGQFKLPRTSLLDRISKIRKGSRVQILPKLGRYEETFTVNYEEELGNHIKDSDDRLMPLPHHKCPKIAFSLVEELNTPHKFSKVKGMASKDFYYDFMKRYLQLSLRTPKSTRQM
jgi:hypothetical protein